MPTYTHAGYYEPEAFPNQNGRPTPGGTVRIVQVGTNTLVTLYADRDRAAPANNPFLLDANGNSPGFYAEPDIYEARRVENGVAGTPVKIEVEVDAEDAIAIAAASLPPALMQGTTLSNQGNSPYWLAMNAARTVLYCLFTNDRCVKAYDLTNEDIPVLLGTSPTLGTAPAYLVVVGTNVFVTDQTDLTVKTVDASNPAAMTVTATVAFSSGGTGGGRSAVNDAGTYLLIGGPESGVNANKVALVDITTPAAPTLAGTSAAIGTVHRDVEFVSGTKWAVTSRDDASVRIVDTSTPALPAEVALIQTTHGNTTAALAVYGTDLYIGNYGIGFLEKWDVTNPLVPVADGFVAIAAGSEQIAITPDGSKVLVACRPSASLVLVDAATMTVTETRTVSGTVTPGVATTADHAYFTAAGDTTNGLIYVFTLPDTIAEAFDANSIRLAAVETLKANLAGANTFTGTNTLSALLALLLTNDLAEMRFGTTSPIPFKRTSATRMQLDAELRLLALLLYPTSNTVMRAFNAGADSQPTMLLEQDSLRFGVGGATAPDVRFARSGVGRATFPATHISPGLGLATMDIDSTGLSSAQIDALWATAPPNATIVVDSTNKLILIRFGGTWWKSAALSAV